MRSIEGSPYGIVVAEFTRLQVLIVLSKKNIEVEELQKRERTDRI